MLRLRIVSWYPPPPPSGRATSSWLFVQSTPSYPALCPVPLTQLNYHAHQDFVFASTNVEKPNVMINQLLVGGRDDATAEAEGNLALLMPSRLWPGDHFAILAMMTFGVNVAGGAASGGVATEQGAAAGPAAEA